MDESDKLILMVDDNADVHLCLREYLGIREHRVKLLSAHTLEQGVTLFRTHQRQLTFIILDGCLTPYGRDIDTLSLLEEIKASGYGGPVIASSSDRRMRDEMCMLGCTSAVEKGDLVKYLRQYL